MKRVAKRYAVAVTEHVRETIKGPPECDPVARQYVPDKRELTILPEERIDPIGDEAHTPVKGIVHRHEDRVLLKLSGVCAVYCRYCFRREMIGPDVGILTQRECAAALGYIRAHPEIWEVILTGGDPLVLSPRRMKAVLEELEEIGHVRILRIHSRIPVAAPEKITPELCSILRSNKPLYMVVHINHAQEITPAVERALAALQEAGCVILSQSVLLKGVNDSAQILEELFRALVEMKVKPYYLHHPDLAPGTSHFRVSLREGRALVKRLQGRVSGLCLPAYMLDIPGGFGKVPVGPCYLEELANGGALVEDHQGRKHHYPQGTQS